MSDIFNPKKERFNEPSFKNMCEYYSLVDEFKNDYEGTWAKFANEKINWFKPFHTILDETNTPFYRWFDGGELNVAHQCIDRHLDTKKNKAAIIFEGDRGDVQTITYLDLYKNVNRFANLLKEDFL